MGRVFAYNWAFEEDRQTVFDGKKLRKGLPKLRRGDVVLCENIAPRLAEQIIKSGAQLLTCQPRLVRALREKLLAKKSSDENDATIIWLLYQQEPESFRPWRKIPEILLDWRAFKSIQKERIREGNRLWQQGLSPEEIEKHEVYQKLLEAEKAKRKILEEELEKYPIWTAWLKHIKGVGPAIAGGLVGYVDKLGIENINTVSALWKYCGLAVEDGVAQRRKRGVAGNYNPQLKCLCLKLLGDSFIRQGTQPYRSIYDEEKARQKSKVFKPGELKAKYPWYPEYADSLKPIHAELRARRKMVKIFLAHLWVIWRTLEGCEVRPPYAHEKLGHSDYIEPPFCPEPVKALIASWKAGKVTVS